MGGKLSDNKALYKHSREFNISFAYHYFEVYNLTYHGVLYKLNEKRILQDDHSQSLLPA